MPQGKGTYGSQVGSPPKKGKKKYYGGGSVDPFSTRNPEGVAVEQAKEAIATQNEAQQGIPTANAMDRSQVMPDTEQYNKGGKVDVTDVVKGITEPFSTAENIASVVVHPGIGIVSKALKAKSKAKKILKGKKK